MLVRVHFAYGETYQRERAKSAPSTNPQPRRRSILEVLKTRTLQESVRCLRTAFKCSLHCSVCLSLSSLQASFSRSREGKSRESPASSAASKAKSPTFSEDNSSTSGLITRPSLRRARPSSASPLASSFASAIRSKSAARTSDAGLIGWARHLDRPARVQAAGAVFAFPWVAVLLGYPIDGINVHGAAPIVLMLVLPATILSVVLLLMTKLRHTWIVMNALCLPLRRSWPSQLFDSSEY